MITYKSLTMIKEKDGNHMEEIEEILCKDSRYGGGWGSFYIRYACSVQGRAHLLKHSAAVM